MIQTQQYEGMLAETVTLCGGDQTWINAYLARPLGAGPFPAVVLLHHMPGWDEWYREATRRFAHHGYVALSPNLYFRVGHGTPEDVAVKVRAEGGIPDDQVVGDTAGAVAFLRSLPYIDHGKTYEFYRYPGAGHGFFYYHRPNYRQQQAVDGWERIFAFLARVL